MDNTENVVRVRSVTNRKSVGFSIFNLAIENLIFSTKRGGFLEAKINSFNLAIKRLLFSTKHPIPSLRGSLTPMECEQQNLS